ncbi:hypothetical protein S740_001376 [Salmonella enterica subsp. enterica]|nr:hypothetical protein [Salmonella enterica subsp. enterica serovar Newport]EDV3120312.1 hypothetical protein [Salmonella enterica subsp. enterica]
MSTVEQLLNADIKEAAYRKKRYMSSSNLPLLEKVAARPLPKKSPRDRCLFKILSMNLGAITEKFCGGEK